jgi:nitroimidazol reductase NimA-like FMN-containing flavoprotein (pyridoxamine 5'-phosphate oxidase superfamily)
MTATEGPEGRERELDEATCRQLLGTTTVGRLAFNDEPSPTVLPVNYVVHRGTVLFRTIEGSKLDAADAAAPASFEVDHVDTSRGAGWSVLARGHLRELDDPDEDEVAAAYGFDTLAGGARPYLVEMTIESLTGRRIAADPSWVERQGGNTWTDRDGSDLLG